MSETTKVKVIQDWTDFCEYAGKGELRVFWLYFSNVVVYDEQSCSIFLPEEFGEEGEPVFLFFGRVYPWPTGSRPGVVLILYDTKRFRCLSTFDCVWELEGPVALTWEDREKLNRLVRGETRDT